MNKNACFLLAILIVSSVSILKPVVRAESETRRVPTVYPTIQGAVDAANPGDVIQVSAGTYNENLIVSKVVSLIGENSETTIIDGGAAGTVVEVRANNIYVSGFTIRNSGIGTFYSGIHVDSFYENALVAGNVIVNNEFGVSFEDTQNNTLSRNIIMQNNGNGVYFGDAIFSNVSDNIIMNNTVGLRLERASTNNIIHRNTVTNNSIGVYLTGNSNNNLVYDNILENNTDGLNLASSYNVIRENTLRYNFHGVYSASLEDVGNVLYRNNLISNIIQASLSSNSLVEAWDNGAEGNFWSDYHGQDLNGDGIGDTQIPYHGFDWHPLIEPWSPLRVFNVTLDSQYYVVSTLSNSTIASFNFNQSLSEVSFNITGQPRTLGSCILTVPKALITLQPPEQWAVTLDGIYVLFTLTENSTHISLYFSYVHGTRTGHIKVMKSETSYPIADFAYSPTNPRVDRTVNFTDLSTPPATIVSWNWEFGDGNISTQQNPQHQYVSSGQYVVTLTIEDKSGAKTAAFKALSVRKVGTTLTIDAPSKAFRGDRLRLAGTLKDEDQKLVSDVIIGFYLFTQGVWASIGSNETSLGGGASISYLASVEPGTYQFKAVFSGTQTLDESSRTFSIEIEERAEIFGGLLPWLTVAALIVIIAVIIALLFIRRRGKRRP